MRSYTLPRWNGPASIKAAPILPIDNLQWTEPVDIFAKAQLCWDETALYVRLCAHEHDIRAEHTGRPCMVCEDSCLEFFLRPYESDMRYFNFEFNPNCALYLGFGAGMKDLTRLLAQDEDALFAPRAARIDGGWEICYRIPAEFIRRFFPGFSLSRGQKLRGNCYKCGDLTVQPHFLSWNKMQCDTPAFHRPQDFGELVLG